MFLDLDSEASLDPIKAGAKAAWLAMARCAGLPVLPGFVVIAEASRRHMELGAKALVGRGSGGARLAVSGEPFGFADELVALGSSLADRLVARSSAPFEDSGVWSGAFTSYTDLAPEELGKGVVGCWASAFGVDALERQAAVGRRPGDLRMAVLIQPALNPVSGGSARIDDRGVVTVHGVEGSPAPLLQGWVSGATATWDGAWTGDELIEIVGREGLDAIGDALREALSSTRANVIEWAIDGDLWILQLSESADPTERESSVLFLDSAEGVRGLVEAVTLAPGTLGEELVHPWALGGLPAGDGDFVDDPIGALNKARELSDVLASHVWQVPAPEARIRAGEALRRARSGELHDITTRTAPLTGEARSQALCLLANIEVVLNAMVESGVSRNQEASWFLGFDRMETALRGETVNVPSRVGIGKWEPLIGATVLALGETVTGTAAVPGLGAGKAARVDGPEQASLFAPRNVLSSPHPEPPLAPLLWDAAGVVTEAGSPAAHFFDSTRSLGVPAVSGVTLDDQTDLIVAVDGHAGSVTTLPIERRTDG